MPENEHPEPQTSSRQSTTGTHAASDASSRGWKVLQGDCVERIRELDDCSVDAICTDPPYGLEFMGKEWDRFRVDAGTPRWRGKRAGAQGKVSEKDPKYAASAFRVAYGGQRATTSRCRTCGKRDAFRNPHACGDAADWIDEPVDPNEAPASMLAFENWVTCWAREAIRVLKPGGHLLAFGGTRTYHRLASALENAGFEIRDCIAWMYGSGFPKSLDVSKALDAQAGYLRGGRGDIVSHNGSMSSPNYDRTPKGEPITIEAQRWQGWGTALKPAYEPIVVARKPLAGTVAHNVMEHGTGAVNVDGCRIATKDEWDARDLPDAQGGVTWGGQLNQRASGSHPLGRWPANVAVDPEAARTVDMQIADRRTGAGPPSHDAHTPDFDGSVADRENGLPSELATGVASRFFYCAKASGPERNAGLEAFDEHENLGVRSTTMSGDGQPVKVVARANHHPTVKPIELMRWLCRLVTPPGGLVLDPFAGSGTTGCAASLEGFAFLGIEREARFVEIAEARIAWWAKHRAEGKTDSILAAGQARDQIETGGQLSMFELLPGEAA